MLIPLHVQSSYSFCEGLAPPAALVAAAVERGLPALALTDRGLTGAVEFYQAAQAAGIKPLLGLRLDLAIGLGPVRLVLLALDRDGWGSLCRLSSRQQGGDAFAAGLPFDELARDTAGLLAVADCDDTEALARLRDLFPGRLYLGLTGPGDAARPAQAASLGIPAAALPPILYLNPQDADLQRTAAAIRLVQPRASLGPADLAPPGAYFLSPPEAEAAFRAWPEAVQATHEIAARCQAGLLPLGEPHYPAVTVPSGRSAEDELAALARQGAERLYGAGAVDLAGRLQHELEVINNRGYAPLFLIMREILDFARAEGVPIASRGSAASSLVAHCLGLTSPDPVRLNLYFERFLNPARSTPPDIDTDLCSRRRERVIQHVFDQYGIDRCALVCTINRFRARSALREAAKAFGLAPAEAGQLVEQLPERWDPGFGKRPGSDPYEPLAARHPQLGTLFQHAARLIGQPHHLSLHPGGVIIAPGPVTSRVATFRAAKGLPATQLDLDALGALGLIKIDLLGIRGLTVLGDVAAALAERQGVSPAMAVLDSIRDDDPATRELVRGARTIGCFQIESPGMRATLREIQAQSPDDLLTALALYRPGPLTGGLKDAFVRRHLGQEPVRHLHPALAPLLGDTYGVILFQEQVLRLAHDLAGMSLADADLLRRAMSHFDPGKQMASLQERFVAGAAERSGVPPAVGQRVWELMAAFAGYGFPKAHAASYAQVAWRAAWCKAHHPDLFMAAVLANWGGYYRQRVYLTEARRLGLALRPPHINHAGPEFSVAYDSGRPVLYMGLDQVRDLTRRTIAAVLHGRPFRSLGDFLARVDPRPAEADALVRVGALEGLGVIPALLRELGSGRRERGQYGLFDGQAGDGDDWSIGQKVAAQEELLEASVIAHPLELVADKIAAAGAVNTLEAAGRLGQRVRVAGMRQTWRRTLSQRGEYVYFMALEDLDGMLEVVIFSDVYRRHRAALSASAGPFVIEGRLELDPGQGEPTIRAERIWPLD